MALTTAVQAWRDAGGFTEFRNRQIYVHRRDGDGQLLVLLHGFPTSSFDWRGVLERTTGPALTFDFLGYGLSDKPADHVYTLAWQADLVEEMVRRYGGGRKIVLVAHDMGTSVTTELLARDIEGKLSFKPERVLLFNGSMILELATPTLGQKLLRSRAGPAVSKRASKRGFKWQLGSVFSKAHPLTDADADDLWSLQTYNDGHRIGHKIIYYMDERERFTERWHGAIRDWRGELSLAWGLLDPVANTGVLARLRELRPGVQVTELPGLAHYPQVEDPGAIVAVVEPLLVAAR